MANTSGGKYATWETKTIRENSTTKKPVSAESQPVKGTRGNGGIKKEYRNDAGVCRVTFTLPKEAVNGSESVCVVGDFNNWDTHANPMEKAEGGEFFAVFDLDPGREYQFRYLIDESRWENDWNADRYVKSCYGDSDNSVVVT